MKFNYKLLKVIQRTRFKMNPCFESNIIIYEKQEKIKIKLTLNS